MKKKMPVDKKSPLSKPTAAREKTVMAKTGRPSKAKALPKGDVPATKLSVKSRAKIPKRSAGGFWQHSALFSWGVAGLLFAGVGALLWFYLPGKPFKTLSPLPESQTQTTFAEKTNNNIGNYLLMEYWEYQNDYQQARRFYGGISNWLGHDNAFRGRAFLGYLFAGDYGRATAFFGTLENITADGALGSHGANLDWLGASRYGFDEQPYGDWEDFFHALNLVVQEKYEAALEYLPTAKRETFVFRYAVPIVEFFIEKDDKPLDVRWQKYGDIFRSDSSLYITMRLSRAAMQRNWQQIVTDAEDLKQKDRSLPFRTRIFYIHGLYHLGRKQEALDVIANSAEAHDINRLYFADIKDAISDDRLAPLPTQPQYYIAEQFLYLAQLLRSGNIDGDETLLLTRLGLYLAPRHAGLQSALAETLSRQSKLSHAIAIRENLQTAYENEDFPLSVQLDNEISLAQLYADAAIEDETRDPRRSIKLLRQLQKQYPGIYQFYIHEGNIWQDMERYKRALKAYNKAFATLPFDDYRLWQPDFLDLQEIFESPQQAAFLEKPEIQPWRLFWQAFYLRGAVYERLGDLQKAQDDLMFAVAFNSQSVSVLNYLGYIWADEGINLDDSLTLLQRAIALERNNGALIDSLAWVYYRKKEYSQAANILEAAIELLPDDAVVNDHLGDVYWRLGLTRDARFQWQRALDLGPEPDQIDWIDKKLRHGLAEED